MNRQGILLVAAALLLPAAMVSAQKAPVVVAPVYDTAAELLADPGLSNGTSRLYPTGQCRPTPAPEGYKPFYISHIGRHGSRYALGTTVYADMLEVLDDAEARGLLTREGRALREVYSSFYPQVAHREGELTGKGQEQHRQIVRQMYRDYPEVFEGPTRAEALSTDIHRVIVSMYSFLDEACRLDDDLVWNADYGRIYLPVLLPDHSDSPVWKAAAPYSDEVVERTRKFNRELVDIPAVLGKWFTCPDSLSRSPEHIIYSLYAIISDLDDLDTEAPEAMRHVLTQEQMASMWEMDNYRWYLMMGRAPGVDNKRVDEMGATVADFIEKAFEDWRDGVALRLRFSHDSALAPLLTYMNVNGMGASVADPREVKNHWRTYDITMACNLQLIFFRRCPQDDDMLIQVLLNGSEAWLPIAPACPGFYSWNDFVAYYTR